MIRKIAQIKLAILTATALFSAHASVREDYVLANLKEISPPIYALDGSWASLNITCQAVQTEFQSQIIEYIQALKAPNLHTGCKHLDYQLTVACPIGQTSGSTSFSIWGAFGGSFLLFPSDGRILGFYREGGGFAEIQILEFSESLLKYSAQYQVLGESRVVITQLIRDPLTGVGGLVWEIYEKNSDNQLDLISKKSCL